MNGGMLPLSQSLFHTSPDIIIFVHSESLQTKKFYDENIGVAQWDILQKPLNMLNLDQISLWFGLTHAYDSHKNYAFTWK